MIVCVIGLGLIGGSVATSLKNRGFTSEIIGVDSNEKHCKEALEIGFVNKILPLKDAVSLAQVILLTIPVFFPVIIQLDFGMSYEETAIWFGILTLIVVEVGLITPPVGLNAFIINKIAGDIPIKETFKGVLPFLISDFLRVILLFAFPGITLFLVRLLY